MSDHTLPRTLDISLFANGQPLAGGWVIVHLGTTKKNSHGFLAGPTDAEGRMTVPGQRIEERVQEQLATSPMDYGGLEAWDGLINVEPLTRETVRGVFEAMRTWDSLDSIDSDIEGFQAFRDKLERLAGAELTVAAGCEPAEVAPITTVARRA